jgi:hypothetical protein
MFFSFRSFQNVGVNKSTNGNWSCFMENGKGARNFVVLGTGEKGGERKEAGSSGKGENLQESGRREKKLGALQGLAMEDDDDDDND